MKLFGIKTNNKVEEAKIDKVERAHIEPVEFKEAKLIGQLIKERKVISIDFSKTPNNTILRIVDFITGTLVAVDGTFSKVNARHYILAPTKELAEAFAKEIIAAEKEVKTEG